MGKGNDYRPARKRGYDDEQYSPPSTGGSYRPRPAYDQGAAPYQPRSASPEPTGPTVEAVVKWFKADKGFGFVELKDGGGDAFLHVRSLQPSGHEEVPAGATLKVMTGQGQKGLQVTRVVDVDLSTASARPAVPRPGASGPRPGGRRDVDVSTAQRVEGVVKWYNPDKGFGFVSDPAGGKDVFLHVSVVQAAGMHDVDENQPVNMLVVVTPKGREAVRIVT